MEIKTKYVLLKDLKGGDVFKDGPGDDCYMKVVYSDYSAINLNGGYLVKFQETKIVQPVKAVLTVTQ